jgi:threonyl-tRNA synthetase
MNGASMQEAAGGGLVFWLPKGAAVRNVLETFWKDMHVANGYSLLYTPHIAKVDLWKTSGHLEHYGESMFNRMQVCACMCSAYLHSLDELCRIC